MNTVLETLLTRRSVVAKDMVAPGPTDEQIDQILSAGHRVPDHGKIGPWRFILFKDEARTEFGQILGRIAAEKNPEASDALLEYEQNRFNRAPLVIAVIASPNVEHKVPVWEQHLAAGAVCQNMLLAATGLGFASQWLTEWYAYDEDVKQELELNENEAIAGFIYIGSAEQKPKERVRPDIGERITYWNKK